MYIVVSVYILRLNKRIHHRLAYGKHILVALSGHRHNVAVARRRGRHDLYRKGAVGIGRRPLAVGRARQFCQLDATELAQLVQIVLQPLQQGHEAIEIEDQAEESISPLSPIQMSYGFVPPAL